MNVVRVEFLDHVSSVNGIPEPIPCIAYGLLLKQDKLAIYLVTWTSPGCDNDNADAHTIIKSTILSIKTIYRERKKI